MNGLRIMHRWLGLFLGLFVLAVALSGGILVLHDPILRYKWPQLAAPVNAGQELAYPEVLSGLERRFAEPGIALIKFPDHGMNAFRLWLRDESEALAHPTSGDLIARWAWNQSFTSVLYELHAHFLAGDVGEQMIGWLGILVTGFVLSGLVLWWPARRAFRLRFLIPTALSPRRLLQSHIAAGMIFSAPILLFTLTGVTMVYYRPVATLLTSLFDSRPPLTPNVSVSPSSQPRRPWHEILATLAETLPDGKLVYYVPSRPENAVMTFRKRMPGEWHPNGRSFILVNPYTGRALQAIDAREQEFGMRLVEKFYPLHASKVGGWPYALFALATSGVLASVAVTGCLSYLRRRPSAPGRTERGRRRSPL